MVFQIQLNVYCVMSRLVCLTWIFFSYKNSCLFVNMADCNGKVDYWQKRKVYGVLKDDSVSVFLYVFYFFLLEYTLILYSVFKGNYVNLSYCFTLDQSIWNKWKHQ